MPANASQSTSFVPLARSAAIRISTSRGCPPRLLLQALALALLLAAPPPVRAVRRAAADEGGGAGGEGLLAVAGEGEAGLADPGDVPAFLPEGVAFELLQQIESTLPARVKVIISSRGLAKEYVRLMKALYKAPKGRMQAWKSSALYRTMYIGGHEAAFRAKDVDIYLTKESGASSLDFSVLKLWFVDRTVEKVFTPEHVYRDGMIALPSSKYYSALFHNLSEAGQVPLAAAALPYDGFVNADKSSMPVDVLKLVESKGADAVHYNMNLAARINIGDGSPFDAAWAIENYRIWMKKVGLDIYLSHDKIRVECNKVKTKLRALVTQITGVDKGEKKCFEIEQRIEYYDMDLVEGSYRPMLRYPQDRVIAYMRCNLGEASGVRRYANQYLRDAYLLYSDSESKNCRSKVAGAIPRHKEEGCKCLGDNMAVFCGSSKVAGRKFKLGDSLAEACEKGSAGELYCAEAACKMPDW